MSLCDSCLAPGACCKSLTLISGGNPITVWKGDAIGLMHRKGLPFFPIDKVGEWVNEEPGSPDDGRIYEQWRWTCPKLTAEGRCSIYDRRPELCRTYEPASDGLCVHWRGYEAGDASAGLTVEDGGI